MNRIKKYFHIFFYSSLIVLLLALPSLGSVLLTVEADNYEINEYADYELKFQTTVGEYFKIFQGEFVVTLPIGFDTDRLESVDVIDEFKHFSYSVREIVIDDNLIHLYLKLGISYSLSEIESAYPSESTHRLDISVILSQIKNPSETGDYQISLEGYSYFQKLVIGPLTSDPFTITSTPQLIHSIVVTPSDNIILKAGTEQPFSASAYDKFGEKIEGVVFEWSLMDCDSCIGQFSDSSLFVTKVGEGIAQATASGVSGFSGSITVIPGELYSISLDIPETQFVGNVINKNASITLYDAYQNLKTDYDLSTFPIELVPSRGELNRYFLDNNDFLIDGVVRIDDFEIIYQGLSGAVSFFADNGSISSNLLTVYFNNYDIVDLQNELHETLRTVKIGETTSANVLVQNNGNLKANDSVVVFYYWETKPDYVYRRAFIPSELGAIDEVPITLPGGTQANTFDELVIRTESKFVFEGDTIKTMSENQFTIEILDVSHLSIVADSFKPDFIRNQIPFNISFNVAADGFTQAIDSTLLTVSVLDKISRQIIGDVYNGKAEYQSFENGFINYGNIPSLLQADQELSNGWYDIVVDYQLFASGNILTLSEPFVDSIFVLFNEGISYVEGSLTPVEVYAGTNVSFEFQVNLESSVPYSFYGSSSVFRIYDNSFSSSTNLFLDTDSLYPGVNTLRSAVLPIQPEQVGVDLLAEAKFEFSFQNLSDTIMFIENFATPIIVHELPLIQILDLEVIAPNSPFVNSSQEIQFKATVANLSSNVLDSIQLELKTIDGLSNILNPLNASYNVQAFDTVSILFDVVTSPNAQTLPESFRVDVADYLLGTIHPINNSAYLIIEEEAFLEISYRINGLENADGAVVLRGENIHIQLDVTNIGTAQVTNGTYQLITSGFALNLSDTLLGILTSDSTIDFDFHAPIFDAEMQFDFTVLETPIDKNNNMPVSILNKTFGFSVLSVSNTAQLMVEPIFITSNLVLPGRVKDVFDLEITNNSTSTLNSIQLDFIKLQTLTISHADIDVREVFNVGNSQFYDNGNKLTITTSGGNELIFWFTGFIIAPQETRTIRFSGEFKNSSTKEIILEMPISGFKATFSEGPKIGQNATVTTIGGGSKILSYQLVLKGNSLPESFLIQNNPFNPTLESVQFAFELTEAAPIEFQIFTLTGEEVYRSLYSAGSLGASVGENIIYWDGYNNSGDMVLNGVYIASIINKETGEYARIKVAVVK